MSDPGTTTSKAEADAVAQSGHTPTAARSTGTWVVILMGPIVWFLHFGAVYLLAEAACEFGWLQGGWGGLRGLSWAILAATAVAVLPVIAASVVALGRWSSAPSGSSVAVPASERGGAADEAGSTGATAGAVAHNRDRALSFVGLLLGLLFTLAIVAVGLPAAWLTPC